MSEHIVKSFDTELVRLTQEIGRMGEIASAQLDAAVDVLIRRDSRAAERVVANDEAIDALEREVSHDVLRLLALRQPMARDLREVYATLRISSDIERIGDYAANVAKRSMVLNQSAPVAPVHDWEVAKGFCEAVARTMATIAPKRYVATASKELRKGRLFIDWLRNGRGATSVASWSLRARPGAGVAMPVRWEELGRAKSGDHYDLAGALRRAARLSRDPWEGWDAASTQELPSA